MDPAKLKVVDLRAELQRRGLDSKGNKPVLVERLRKALEQENTTRDPDQQASNIEDSHESPVKENSEKSAEAGKPPQTPKSSGRASRSLSVITPTKMSTRNAPRTPNSKQSTPTKVQRSESPIETLPTIAECENQESESKEVSSIKSPIKVEENPAKEVPEPTHNETPPSPEEKEVDDDQEKSKDIENPEKDNECDPTVEESTTEVPEESNKVANDPVEKSEYTDHKTDEPETLLEAESEQEDTPALEAKDNKEIEESKEPQFNDTEENLPVEKHSPPEGLVAQIATSEDNAMDTTNDNNEVSEDTIIKDKDEIKDIEEKANDHIDTVDKDMTQDECRSPQTETATETEAEHDKNEPKDEEQAKDIEMAETKQEDEDEAMKDSQDDQEKTRCIDRKRKRSVSPAEEQPMSPVSTIVENEPDIDDSALVLSWYDSDLNLVIEKDGFFTATPLHNDGFSHMWAGARASYGFLNGKVYYETKIIEECDINSRKEERPHALRVGWSAINTSMQLGEERESYGYESSGKKSTNNEFVDYGQEYTKDDIIGCYLDATSEDNVHLSYTLNGKDLGTAFTIPKQDLENKPLYPHILSRGCKFACNFGQENPWSEHVLDDYVSIGNVDAEYKVPGPRRPEKKEDCEVILLCGLPGCGKTTWAMKHATKHPTKLYNILGVSSIIDKMKDFGVPRKENYNGNWNLLIENCTRALNTLLEMAPTRRRNYILDETNVYPSAQRRKMKNFSGYQRKAVVIVPTEEEFKLRAAKYKPIEGTETSETALMELKANFGAPAVGDSFDSVEWLDQSEEEGKKLIEKYNKEAKDAGYGHQANKRARIDKAEGSRDTRDVRNNRDSRDHRDRRNNYSDRNRNPAWRGMGRRDRPQRGGPMRHGGGYGPPVIPWRGRGVPLPPPHRGMDRRGGDRRGGDRGRSGGARQGGWGPMSNYQGQPGGWSQQSSWSGSQSGGWGQGGWGGQQWGNWKSYGQGSYGQTNYNQQGYGNGNWNSWNPQYYNQYWDQPQQTGQTTTAGGQAISSTESVTAAASSDSAATYSYPQEWQEYTEGYYSEQSADTDTRRFQRHE